MPGWQNMTMRHFWVTAVQYTRPAGPIARVRRPVHRSVRRRIVPLFIVWMLLAAASLSQAYAADFDPASICDRAATEAAAATGVPISVLKAISLTETGRNRGGTMRPWPWTVNMEGKGMWFDGQDAALAYVYEHFKRGARSFDVGCFQINYKWHHEHFASIEEMFDPLTNALYAARFLLSLHAESGDWEVAAGAFHSRTPEYANRYKARFAAYRAEYAAEDNLPLRTGLPVVPVAPAVGASQQRRARVNTFPLFQGGGGNALGSLVPLADRGGATGLFARADAG